MINAFKLKTAAYNPRFWQALHYLAVAISVIIAIVSLINQFSKQTNQINNYVEGSAEILDNGTFYGVYPISYLESNYKQNTLFVGHFYTSNNDFNGKIYLIMTLLSGPQSLQIQKIINVSQKDAVLYYSTFTNMENIIIEIYMSGKFENLTMKLSTHQDSYEFSVLSEVLQKKFRLIALATLLFYLCCLNIFSRGNVERYHLIMIVFLLSVVLANMKLENIDDSKYYKLFNGTARALMILMLATVSLEHMPTRSYTQIIYFFVLLLFFIEVSFATFDYNKFEKYDHLSTLIFFYESTMITVSCFCALVSIPRAPTRYNQLYLIFNFIICLLDTIIQLWSRFMVSGFNRFNPYHNPAIAFFTEHAMPFFVAMIYSQINWPTMFKQYAQI